MADDSGDVILDSDWLPSWQCIKIWSRFNVLRYGAESRVNVCNAFIKIWNDSFSALCDNFRHCEVFSKKFSKILGRARPRE